MAMTFAYQPRPVARSSLVEGDVVYRPLVPVALITDRDASFVWALADTGADHTLLPASLAEAIGIPLGGQAATTTVQGFGGTELTVIASHVDMVIRSDQQRWQWSASVGVVQFDDPTDEVVVLGHGGFFEFFAATFDSSARELSLVPTSKFPGTVDTQ